MMTAADEGMKTMTRIIRLALALICLAPAGLAAQTPVAAVASELVLRDGSRVYGTIERETDTEVVFRSSAGVVMTAARDQIVSLRTVEGVVQGEEFHPADPNATRLFFAPTGRSLARGEAYIGVYQFLVPMLQVGITDRFSMGGGTPLVFGFGEDGGRPFWLTPKLQLLNRGETQIAVGSLHLFGLGDPTGVAYVVGTNGNAARSISVGGGMAYGGDGGRAAVFMIGGDRAVRRNMKFISENYVTSTMDVVVSGGVRFFGERLSADLAFTMPVTTEFAGVLPVVNFVYLF
jgi:hypothetical protein